MTRPASSEISCRFCATPAIAQFAMDRGCACYPNDRQQDLCVQHIISAEPLGSMELSQLYDAGAYAWLSVVRGDGSGQAG